VKGMPLPKLHELMAKHLGASFGREALTALREDEAAFDGKGPLSIRVKADHVGQVDKRGTRWPWVGFRLPGEACRVVGSNTILDLLEACGLEGKLKVSRLDVALDGFDRKITPRQFAEACVDGSLCGEKAVLRKVVVTRVRRDNWNWSRRKGGCLWVGGANSSRLLRVYDKEVESKGEITSVRFELQNRNRFATGLTQRFLDARWEKRALSDVFAEHLVDFVDIREPRGSRSRSQDWRRVRWWQELVGKAKAAHTPVGNPSGVEAWRRACSKQCRGFLSVVLRNAGVTEGEYEAMVEGPGAEGRLAAGVKAAVGRVLPKLSPDQVERLRQLQELERRRLRQPEELERRRRRRRP